MTSTGSTDTSTDSPGALEPSTSAPARRVRQALTTLVLASGTVVLLAEAAHAGRDINHNETPARDAAGRRRVRHAVAGLAAVAAAAAPLAVEAPHVVARIALNHNQSAGRDRVRKAVACLALAAAAAVPVAAVTATPAHAVSGGCPPTWCGDGNHNESAGRDRRSSGRVRQALAGLVLAVAAVGPAAVLTATPAHAVGGCGTWECGANHNETAGR